MKVTKRKNKPGYKIICNHKEASALALLLNCCTTLNAVQAVFPGVFKTDPYKHSHLDEFKNAGINSSEVNTGKHYPNGNTITFSGPCALVHEIAKWGNGYSWKIIRMKPTISLQSYLDYKKA